MPFGFSTPIAAWLALLALPLIAFYFLKLKRPRVQIPSLVLWQQVLNDSRVNSPFQRFKRNLLLWLQLLLLLLLVLAAMQPFLRADHGGGNNLPILIDCSASMAGKDRAGGITRLEEAQRRAATRIGNMARGQRICLIAVGDAPRRLTDFTDNKRELLAALAALQVDPVESDLEDALQMAEALGRATPIEEVLLLSDGNVPASASVELPFILTFERVATAGPNAGITSLRAVRANSREWRVFVGIDASESYRSPATLEATLDGEALVREVIAPTFNAPERIVFTVPGDSDSTIDVRLSSDDSDSLTVDNAASLELPALRPASLYVPDRLPICRRVIEAMDEVELWPRDGMAGSPGTRYDLVITDSLADLELDAAVTLSIGILPPALTGTVARVAGGDRIVDWERGEPLLQHVTLSDVILTGGIEYIVPQGAAAAEERGYKTVVHGNRGPLLMRRETADATRYALLIELGETTLPYRVALPVMLANLVRLSLQHEGLGDADAATAGGGLLSPHETRLESVDRITFAEVAVTASSKPVRGTRALWPPLALAGLLLLLIEWWFFHSIYTLAHREETST